MRRSCSLALPSFPDCRCIIGARHRGKRNHKRYSRTGPHTYSLGTSERHPSHLSGRTLSWSIRSLIQSMADLQAFYLQNSRDFPRTEPSTTPTCPKQYFREQCHASSSISTQPCAGLNLAPGAACELARAGRVTFPSLDLRNGDLKRPPRSNPGWRAASRNLPSLNAIIRRAAERFTEYS